VAYGENVFGLFPDRYMGMLHFFYKSHSVVTLTVDASSAGLFGRTTISVSFFIKDYNAKNTLWGSRLTTTKGKEFHEGAAELACTYQSSRKPTYWPTDLRKISDLLDFFIIRNISANYVSTEENFYVDSDHTPVILTMSKIVIKKEQHLTLVNKKIDWVKFQEDISNNIQLKVPLRTIGQLNWKLKM
jgi:hypothetical protein